MFELIRAGECSYYIDCPAKMGLYQASDSEVYLIDSGNDKEAGKKALRRFMIDEKIPADKRDQVALLADGDHVIWIIGWRISNYYKIGPDTKRVLQVKIKNGDQRLADR